MTLLSTSAIEKNFSMENSISSSHNIQWKTFLEETINKNREPITISQAYNLDDSQTKFVQHFQKMNEEDACVLEAPAGTGKTLISIIASLTKDPATILFVASNEHSVFSFEETCQKMGLNKPFQPFTMQQNKPKTKPYNGLCVPHIEQPSESSLHLLDTLVSGRLITEYFDEKFLCLDIETIAKLANIKKHYGSLKAHQIVLKNKKFDGLKLQEILSVNWDYLKFTKIMKQAFYNEISFVELYKDEIAQNKQKIQLAFKEHWNHIVNETPSSSFWITDQYTANHVLPLTSNMFSYVIIDEAHAVSLAESIPLLMRGKRQILLGDRKQISPNKSLSSVLQKDSPYQETILSFLDSQWHVPKLSLTNHYRCVPDLISFSNKNYYKSKLNIMTKRPNNKSITSFKYSKNLFEDIIGFINEHDGKGSIGIFVADDKKYVTSITAYIQNNIKIKREWHLKIDTVETFAGGERDYVLFIVKDEQDLQSEFYNSPTHINVMTTRGKYGLQILSSIQKKTILQNKNAKEFSKLLNHIHNQNVCLEKVASNNAWTHKIGETLKDAGFKIRYNTKIGDKTANIALGDIDRTLVINTKPGGLNPNDEIKVVNLYESEWSNNLTRIIEEIPEIQKFFTQ